MTNPQQSFAEARPEIAELLRLASEQFDQVEAGRRMSAQENVARHITVALVAVLQAYVTDLLEQKADELGDDWDGLNELEKQYVAVQSSKRIAAFWQQHSEADLAEARHVDSLKAMIAECAEWYTTPSALARSAYRVKLDGFLRDNGSVVLDRVISRFGKCGMSFFNWLSKNHPRYRGIEDSLNIMIDTRNDVVHGGFRRRVTIRDVRLQRVLVYRMIGKIQPFIVAPAPV